jgi:hypothetical protein
MQETDRVTRVLADLVKAVSDASRLEDLQDSPALAEATALLEHTTTE